MLKTIILRQKEEKERLLARAYVERTKTAATKKWLASTMIKAVLGPRRAGKSVFSLMLLKDLPFAYFNFDDEELFGQKNLKSDEIMQGLKTVYGEFNHILFDEIQNLPNWELFASRLQRTGYNLTITGSNANLLSRELSTHLTGRHIPVEILPFDFGEFLRANDYHPSKERMGLAEEKGRFLNLLEQYMTRGGYPEVVVQNLEPKIYLGALFDSILLKDVVGRHRVKNSEQLDRLAAYLINNVSAQYSGQKLARILGFRSNTTVEKYLGYLNESYSAFLLQRYSDKAGQRLSLPRKIYAVDNGYIAAKNVPHSPDRGKLAENMVFGELLKRGRELNRGLFYYKTRNGREIDFVVKEGVGFSELIQVSYDTNSRDTEDREIKALVEASEELRSGEMKILTWDIEKNVKKDGKTIEFVPLWRWCLQ